MRIVSVDELKGGEYLAKPVIVENNRTLFYEGTCLYMKHIENLLSLGIESVSNDNRFSICFIYRHVPS